ncbi:MAG TPA: LPS biosynthesis protein WbpP [Chloroflexi bacterium]|jgi:UDP-glucose 4-epimerase|nr:LPS biosynthesis protein WbpP [Chloroflexota bacterium]HAL27864.1 LPS biosynthesis protein WbpP [Chloroflexota bacterium]
MKPPTHLVTGGAGFIGSNLVRRLVETGAGVRVVDDLSTGKRENLAGLSGVEIVQGDLCEMPLKGVLEGIDVIFHLAAVPSVPRSVADPMRSHAASATATLRLLEAARDAEVRRFITSSSSSVYGDAAELPVSEAAPTSPRSPYAVGKLAAEGYTRVFASLFGMSTVSLRYFNVFGPRQDPDSQYAAVIPRFIGAYLRRERPTVFGDGRQSRDFTFVDNVVEANLLAARALRLDGESINVASGEPYSLLDVLAELQLLFGTRLEPVFEPDRPGDIRHSHANIGRARELLGYEPRVGFREGLRRTAEWFKSTPARSR